MRVPFSIESFEKVLLASGESCDTQKKRERNKKRRKQNKQREEKKKREEKKREKKVVRIMISQSQSAIESW